MTHEEIDAAIDRQKKGLPDPDVLADPRIWAPMLEALLRDGWELSGCNTFALVKPQGQGFLEHGGYGGSSIGEAVYRTWLHWKGANP